MHGLLIFGWEGIMANWAEGICETNGIDIHYLRTGGDKPPVVLLHGLMTNGACWTPLALTLEGKYDVIMPDARGHGKSSAPQQGYSYENLALDVEHLINALQLVSPVLLGHSMGGMTAAVVANQNPRLLQGLVLADPTFLTPQQQNEVYESDIVDQHCQILQRSKEDFLAKSRVRHNHRSNEFIELLGQARFQTSMFAFDILKPPNPDYTQLIKTLDVPTLLIVGDVGSVVTLEMAIELARLNQYLKTVKIEKAGHGVPYDQPEQFSDVVQSFLSSVNN